MRDFKQKIVSGFAWEAGTRLVVQLISWVSTLWVARILSPDDYGIVAISGVFTGLCIKVAGMGLSGAVVQKQVVKDYHLANVFWVGLATSTCIYALLIASSPAIAAYFDVPDLEIVLKVAGLILIISSFGLVPRAVAMRGLMLKQAALISLFSGLALTLSTLTMALAGFGLWSLIISTLIAEAIIVVCFWVLTKFVPERPRKILTVVPYLKFGLRLSFGGVLGFINSQWPIIFVSSFLGQTATGYFQMARLIAGLPMDKIGQIFLSIAFPAFSRIKRDSDRRSSVFLRMLALLYLVTLPMFLGLAVVAPDLLPLLIGSKWLPAVFPIQLICIANVFATGTVLMQRVTDAMGYPGINVRMEIIQLFLLPGLLYFGSFGGLHGLLMAWLVIFPITFLYVGTNLHRILALSFKNTVSHLRPALISGLSMMACVFSFQQLEWSVTSSQIPKLLLEIVVGMMTYSAAILVLDRSRVTEIIGLIRRE